VVFAGGGNVWKACRSNPGVYGVVLMLYEGKCYKTTQSGLQPLGRNYPAQISETPRPVSAFQVNNTFL